MHQLFKGHFPFFCNEYLACCKIKGGNLYSLVPPLITQQINVSCS